eukprot:1171207-Pleurochrysis_carterae.AAC.2
MQSDECSNSLGPKRTPNSLIASGELVPCFDSRPLIAVLTKCPPDDARLLQVRRLEALNQHARATIALLQPKPLSLVSRERLLTTCVAMDYSHTFRDQAYGSFGDVFMQESRGAKMLVRLWTYGSIW